MKSSPTPSLNSNSILARNTFINIAGLAIPLLFAVVSIPFVIDGLGTERFGILTIVWILIGYFGVFDMGIGRATTKYVADQKARGANEVSQIIATSILLLFIFGVSGGILVAFITPLLVNDILNIPVQLRFEASKTLYYISISIPFVLGSIGARGVLEAQQRFFLVNAVKIPASIINYVGPLAVLPFSNQLQHVVLVLVIGRGISFIIYLYFSCKDQDFTGIRDYPFIKWTKKMLSFGAWLTVSNVISPIMEYMDRFILGAILTMTAVAYYTTPYEIVIRLGIISGGFMGVMFPAFSVYALKDRHKLTALHQKSIRYLLLVFIPLVTFLIISAEPLLYFWIGSEFANNSTLVLQILAVGILLNSLARVPSTAIQAIGRPDLAAKLHMIELPFYLTLIWFLAQAMGIVGVALVWVVRVAVDGICLLYLFYREIDIRFQSLTILRNKASKYFILTIALAIICFYYIDSNLVLLIFGFVMGCVMLVINWFYIINSDERKKVFGLYHELKQRIAT